MDFFFVSVYTVRAVAWRLALIPSWHLSCRKVRGLRPVPAAVNGATMPCSASESAKAKHARPCETTSPRHYASTCKGTRTVARRSPAEAIGKAKRPALRRISMACPRPSSRGPWQAPVWPLSLSAFCVPRTRQDGAARRAPADLVAGQVGVVRTTSWPVEFETRVWFIQALP